MANAGDDPRIRETFWRTLAVVLLGVFATGLSGWLLFGLDSVKHSEVDQIMATRAPWVHDKARIDEAIRVARERDIELSSRITELERRMRDLEIRGRKGADEEQGR